MKLYKPFEWERYSDAGPVTCSGTLPGHLGHERVDAETFAEWKIDYLKSYVRARICTHAHTRVHMRVQNCYPQGKNTTNVDKYEIAWASSVLEGCVMQAPSERDRFLPMVSALEVVRPLRNITFELCLYGWDHVEEWAATSGDHLWRATQDIHDTWYACVRT